MGGLIHSRCQAQVLVEDTAVWDAITPACLAREIRDPKTPNGTRVPPAIF